MKTRISILILMIAFAFGASAQSIGDYIDVVYLKNGSTVKGVIIEQIPGKSIKVRTADGSEFVYDIREVEKFTREETSMASSEDGKSCSKDKSSCSTGKSCCSKKKWWNGDYTMKEKGFFKEFGLGGNTSAYSFRITNGYKFGRLGYLGLAVGLENVALNSGYRLPEISLNLVYAGDVFNRKITPYYQIEAGYGFSLDRYGYNKNLLNNNNFGFGKGFGKGKGNDDVYFDENAASTLNYGGPQGALELGVKIHTMKKMYFKLGLDARLTSNFSDIHYFDFDENGQPSSSNKKQDFEVNPGVGARFTIGF